MIKTKKMTIKKPQYAMLNTLQYQSYLNPVLQQTHTPKAIGRVSSGSLTKGKTAVPTMRIVHFKQDPGLKMVKNVEANIKSIQQMQARRLVGQAADVSAHSLFSNCNVSSDVVAHFDKQINSLPSTNLKMPMRKAWV